MISSSKRNIVTADGAGNDAVKNRQIAVEIQGSSLKTAVWIGTK